MSSEPSDPSQALRRVHWRERLTGFLMVDMSDSRRHPSLGEPPPISAVLVGLLDRAGERITLSEMMDAVGGRGFGVVLIIFALPETVPMVGLSLILAIPIGLIGAYMLYHGEVVALPARIRAWSIKRKYLESAVRRALPVLRWAERKSRRRLPRLVRACRAQGAVCLLMSLILAFPMPGPNILAALAVVGTGIGMLLRDGRIIAFAFGLAALAALGISAIFVGAITLAT